VSLDAWLLFCATDTVLCLTPGPAVLFVLSLSLTAGARAASRGIGGILTANAAYFALAATGVGAVLLASWNLFVVLKWLGAAYLAWTGLRMLLARPRHAPAASEELETSSRVERPFLAGLVTQGANPSAIAFFGALLPQFVDPGAPIARQLAILGVTSILIEVLVLAVYVALSQRVRRALWTPALAASVHRAGGVLLLGAAAGLATLRRS
jgi:threonine/homoserine/homoserine lactone efflux protein